MMIAVLPNTTPAHTDMSKRIAVVENGRLLPDQAAGPGVYVDSPVWWAWLNDPATQSFAFRSPAGHFTARKEQRRRGGAYWSAYRRIGRRVAGVYLGKAERLTLAHLTAAASRLATQAAGEAPDAISFSGNAPPSPPATAVLTTKLLRPRPRSTLVPRPRLMHRLDAARHMALTLVAAPAGFGKTTLIADWLHQRSGVGGQRSGRQGEGKTGRQGDAGDAGNSKLEARNPNYPDPSIAWLSLDASDNDPARFVASLIAAVQTVQPAVGAFDLTQRTVLEPAALEALLVLLINELAALDGRLLVVLDDYHIIVAPAIHQALTLLIDRRPPAVQFVVVTREEPPLPLSRWRVHGELLELRAADLRFTSTETQHFFRDVMGLTLAAELVAALDAQTEGWVAGLQLAALAIQDRPDAAEFVGAFTGSTRYIGDYLADEVIGRQPLHLQSFLRQTAILDRLCGSLCDAVVLGASDDTASPYSQLLLSELERRQLFVIPLDIERTWYRYHQLFRESVLRQLTGGASSDELATLHRRAGRWYAEHDLVVEAMPHVLAAQDWKTAFTLLRQHGFRLLATGHFNTMQGWLNALLRHELDTHPELCIFHAISLQLADQRAAAEERLEAAERGLDAGMPVEQARNIDGQICTVRAVIRRSIGDLAGYHAQARQALSSLSPTDPMYSTARVAVAHAFTLSGEATDIAEREVAAAVEPARAAGNLSAIIWSICDRARLHVLQGRLHAAGAAYAEVAQLVPDSHVLESVFSGPSYFIGLGDLLRERNDLDAAEQHLATGLKLAEGARLVHPDVLLDGYVALARLKQARGEHEEARRLLDDFALLARQRGFDPWVLERVATISAQLAVLNGDLDAARAWAAATMVPLGGAASFAHEAEYLTIARVWIAQGRSEGAGAALDDAIHLLGRLRGVAAAQQRGGSLLEIDMLHALALLAHGNIDGAVRAARPVFEHGEREGYWRRLADEGRPMVALLREAQAEDVAPAYCTALLAAEQGSAELSIENAELRNGGAGTSKQDFMARHETSRAQFPVLDAQFIPIEPLTARELDVLRLLATGHSTQAIAGELIVASGTVKRHISNILGKLGVHSRLAAVAHARDLGLL